MLGVCLRRQKYLTLICIALMNSDHEKCHTPLKAYRWLGAFKMPPLFFLCALFFFGFELRKWYLQSSKFCFGSLEVLCTRSPAVEMFYHWANRAEQGQGSGGSAGLQGHRAVMAGVGWNLCEYKKSAVRPVKINKNFKGLYKRNKQAVIWKVSMAEGGSWRTQPQPRECVKGRDPADIPGFSRAVKWLNKHVWTYLLPWLCPVMVGILPVEEQSWHWVWIRSFCSANASEMSWTPTPPPVWSPPGPKAF